LDEDLEYDEADEMEEEASDVFTQENSDKSANS
jgi:hypothetical protein